MNSWTTGGDLAASYTEHSEDLRGALRHALVTRALAHHLPARPQRILDVGGGSGIQARALAARGHHVTILDPDPAMLTRAEHAWAARSEDTAGTLRLLHGRGEDAPRLAGTGWDAVLCHGVLMYLEDPAPLVEALAACTRPGGMLSILAKSAEAMAMRPALERRWADARRALTDQAETGRLGAVSRGTPRAALQDWLAEHRVNVTAWYGVRCFTDHLGEEPVGADFAEILDLEWEAGRRSPYRDIARLFHLIAHREP
ncbi:methyltransferase domain-containing protein [Streptomyces sp. HK10]|uniref:methyltransferase domain-containing protein n=1 Tax=Streptomyces sp. HK10 TaxID=3373255 RepID=UPI003748ED06